MDGCKRCIIERLKDRWIVQAIDQGAMEGAIVDARYEYGSKLKAIDYGEID